MTAAVTILSLFTALCFLYQLLYLILPLFKQPKIPESPPRTRFAVLIAARNEEAVLPELLSSIAAQDYPGNLYQTFVLADHCTDGTAAVAEQSGAVVYTRSDPNGVGKGYALSALLQHMKEDGYLSLFDAFLIFDADNLLSEDYLSQMNDLALLGYDAFCGFRASKNPEDNWLSGGYALWYLHDSVHLNASRMALGRQCMVSGTGFGFSASLLETMQLWPFHTLTEDLEFNHFCAVRGVRVGYTPRAVLYDEQPVSFAVSWWQRTRWLQGAIQVSNLYRKRLLGSILHGSWAAFECWTLGLDGAVLSALTAALCLIRSFLTKPPLTVTLSAAVFTWLSLFLTGAMTLLLAGKRSGLSGRTVLRTLLTFPFFMLTYLPIAVYAVFAKRQWKPILHSRAMNLQQMRSR